MARICTVVPAAAACAGRPGRGLLICRGPLHVHRPRRWSLHRVSSRRVLRPAGIGNRGARQETAHNRDAVPGGLQPAALAASHKMMFCVCTSSSSACCMQPAQSFPHLPQIKTQILHPPPHPLLPAPRVLVLSPSPSASSDFCFTASRACSLLQYSKQYSWHAKNTGARAQHQRSCWIFEPSPPPSPASLPEDILTGIPTRWQAQ